MPTPSPEARANDIERIKDYVKDNRKCYAIHLHRPCSGCWIELTKQNSYGNGMCEDCVKYSTVEQLDLPHPNWSDDMKKMYNKYRYLDRKYFDTETRKLNPTSFQRIDL